MNKQIAKVTSSLQRAESAIQSTSTPREPKAGASAGGSSDIFKKAVMCSVCHVSALHW